MPIGFIDRLKSNNPSGYGIVDAKEVAGHRSVTDLASLYELADPILSLSGNNTDNDALGQLWYVSDEGKFYQLTDWANRKTSAGWTEYGGSGGMNISGTFNVSSAGNSQYASIFSSMSVGDMKMYLVTDSNGNLLYTDETAITVTYDGALSPAFLYFGKSANFGVNVGDILVFAKLNSLTNVCRIIPLNDAKAANGDFPGADGLETVWDKTQINKISGIENTANAALPKTSQLPSMWTNNMDNALQTGVYPWCTLGRPSGSTGAYTCIVKRTSTDDGAYNTIEQTAYGREGELGQIYKRIIFEKTDGTDTQYGEWILVNNSRIRANLIVVIELGADLRTITDVQCVDRDYSVDVGYAIVEFDVNGELYVAFGASITTESEKYILVSCFGLSYTITINDDITIKGEPIITEMPLVIADSSITADKLDSDVITLIDERISSAITQTLNTEV